MIDVLRKNAGIRVAVVSFSAIFAILIADAWRDAHDRRGSLNAAFLEQQTYLIESTASSLSVPLYEFDLDIINAAVEALLAYRHVEAVSVTETTGATVVELGILSRAPITEKREILTPEGAYIGTIEIGYTDRFLKNAIKEHIVALAMRGIILAMLLLGIVLWVVRSLVRPIIKLDSSIRDFDVRGYAFEAHGVTRRDEFGSLARGFQSLSQQLRDLFNDLEKKVEDRTLELRRATKAAENASIAKSQFLANMSHEIRTPMNGVLGMTEVLRETELNERQLEFVDTIYKSGDALVTIINDILDFSKIEAGRLELDPTPFDLRVAVEDVATLLSNAACEKNVELTVRYHPDTPLSVVGDAGRVRQILTNLVGNAIKFTHEGYVLIEVSGSKVTSDSAEFVLKVQDTGIGIAEDKLNAIFDEFTQAEGATTRKFGGTGLGLTISRRLVEAMNGEITADSVIGEGSTFTISLQLPLNHESVGEQLELASLEGKKALVVDDLVINRTILVEQLSSWGVECVGVDSGFAALAVLKSEKERGNSFDFAILDYQMPDMDGADTAAAIKDDPFFSKLKLIVLSSVDEASSLQSFGEISIDACLSKPAKAVSLRKTIGQVLSDGARALSSVGPGKSSALHRSSRVDNPEGEGESTAATINILVAEDNDVNRMVIRTMIERPDRKISFAENGKIALDMFRAGSFDLIFMDVSMPVMDGVEATKAIRAYEAYEGRDETPIVCLTAHSMENDRQRFLNAGMTHYIAKPIKKADVEQCVENLMGVQRKAAS